MEQQHTITWDVSKLDLDSTGQIQAAHFSIWAESPQGKRVAQYGYVKGEAIPSESADRETVLEWIQTSLGEAEITRLTDLLTVQINQDDLVTTSIAPPWIQPASNQ